MKQLLTILMALTFFIVSTSACYKDDDGVTAQTESNNNNGGTENQSGNNMKITIGNSTFTALLNDNPTATAFKAMLPLTITMADLNSNEKYYHFSSTLPTNASVGGNIQEGDLMLYGNNCLVLFYESFNTSYSYTRLGRVENVSGLKTALGTGNVTVKYELE